MWPFVFTLTHIKENTINCYAITAKMLFLGLVVI